MTNLALGLNFIGSGRAVGGATIITATSDPTGAQAMVVDETGNDITNIATFTNTTNYASTAGTISSAQYQINNANAVLGTAFADGDSVSILVTDSAANTRRFTIDGNVLYAPAVNTVAPVASGSTGLGDVLSVTNGTWTGATGGAYSYQWQRGGVDISGATSSSYTIVVADDAASLRCVVTYTNSGGAIPANSNAIAVDDFTAPVITGVPTIAGTTSVGQTLTATAASVTGNPTPTRTWQWYNSVTGAIAGATSSTYVLQASDEGDTVYVIQTETNAIDVDTAQSANTATISSAPVLPIISTFTVGPQSGSDLPITITLGNSEPTPYSLDIVGVPNGESAPSATQIKAGQKQDGSNAPFWIDSYSFSADISAVNITPTRDTLTTGTYDFYAVVTDNDGDESLVSSDTGVSVTVAAGHSITALTPQAVTTSTSTPSYTVDLSGAANGDIYVFTHLQNSTPAPTVTVGGTAATEIQAQDGSTGAKAWAFEYTCDGTETATTTVAFTLAGASNRNVLNHALVSGLTRTAAQDKSDEIRTGTNPLTQAVSVTASSNAVLAVAAGRSSFFDGGASGHAWTGVTEQEYFTTTERESSTATGLDVATGSHDVTFTLPTSPTPGASDEAAVFVFLYE